MAKNSGAKKASENSNVMRQFLMLPIVLGTLLIVTGGIGVYIARNSTTSLKNLESSGVKPTVALAEFSATIREFNGDLLRLHQDGLPAEAKKVLLARSKEKMEKIGASVKEQVELSRGQPYEKYLKKWASEWEELQKRAEPLLDSVEKIEPEVAKIDETVTEMLDKMTNISDFIQYHVQKLTKEQATVASRSTIALSIALAIGVLIGLISSVLIVRSIGRLFQLIAEGKKNIETLLNNLDQGFLVFDRAGVVQEGVSRAATQFFGEDPTGKLFHDALPVNAKKKDDAKSWRELMFEGALEFSDFKPLGPQFFERAGRYVELDFRPIYQADAGSKLEKVICIASDKTEERRLREQAEAESALVKLVITALSDRTNFVSFVQESRRIFASLDQELSSGKPDPQSLIRGVHTLKGGAATFSILKVAREAHRLETALLEMQAADYPQLKREIRELSASFEAFLKSHEHIFGKIGEANQDRMRSIPVTTINDVCAMLFKQMGKESPVFANFVDKFVLEDLGAAFQRYESVVQGIAERQFKKVRLTIEQGKARVYLDPYLPLVSAYVHVFRNAMDHGIEDEITRTELGKAAEGTIRMSFERVRTETGVDRLKILVRDDGRGVDFEAVKRKAVEKNLISAERAASMSDEEARAILFMSGFSTRDETTELSGRGVGLEAVRFEVEKLGGEVSLTSELGKGTLLVAVVPYYDSPVLRLNSATSSSSSSLAA